MNPSPFAWETLYCILIPNLDSTIQSADKLCLCNSLPRLTVSVSHNQIAPAGWSVSHIYSGYLLQPITGWIHAKASKWQQFHYQYLHQTFFTALLFGRYHFIALIFFILILYTWLCSFGKIPTFCCLSASNQCKLNILMPEQDIWRCHLGISGTFFSDFSWTVRLLSDNKSC